MDGAGKKPSTSLKLAIVLMLVGGGALWAAGGIVQVLWVWPNRGIEEIREWRVRRAGYVEALVATTEGYLHGPDFRASFSATIETKRELEAWFKTLPGDRIVIWPPEGGSDRAPVSGADGKVRDRVCADDCLRKRTRKRMEVRTAAGRVLQVEVSLGIHMLRSRDRRMPVLLGDCAFLYFSGFGEARSGPRFFKSAIIPMCDSQGTITPEAFLQAHLYGFDEQPWRTEGRQRTADAKFDALREFLVTPYYACSDRAFRTSPGGAICNAQVPLVLAPAK